MLRFCDKIKSTINTMKTPYLHPVFFTISYCFYYIYINRVHNIYNKILYTYVYINIRDNTPYRGDSLSYQKHPAFFAPYCNYFLLIQRFIHNANGCISGVFYRLTLKNGFFLTGRGVF